MTFMVLVIYGTYLYDFIPLPGKGQSISSRMHEWRAYVTLLVEHFHETQARRVDFVALSVVVIACFAASRYLAWVSGGLAISLAITLTSMWEWWQGNRDGSDHGPPLARH